MGADSSSPLQGSLTSLFSEPRSRQILLRHIQAFDLDGDPDIELKARPPGRLAAAASRVAQAIAAVVAPVVNLATIAAVAGVLVLLALHRLGILEVLDFLRGT